MLSGKSTLQTSIQHDPDLLTKMRGKRLKVEHYQWLFLSAEIKAGIFCLFISTLDKTLKNQVVFL